MIVISSPVHEGHDPNKLGPLPAGRTFWDTPARIAVLLKTVRHLGHHVIEAPDHGVDAIAAIHDRDYLEFLATAVDRWTASGLPGPAVRPFAFAVRHMARRPASIAGLAGYYLASFSAPLLPATWQASVGSAHAAIEAADRILAGASDAYALCRPPGHHAYADLAYGYCYLNNAAIAAQRLLSAAGPIAILDFDSHHGNGTQGIFYARNDVHFVSVHSDPAQEFPFFAGYADETGTGRGIGWNLNIPLPAGTGDEGFVAAIERGLDSISRRAPAVIVISMGFDAHRGDPSGNLSVSLDGFRVIGERIGSLKLPTLLVQEGGYLVERLGDVLTAFLEGFSFERTNRSLGQ
jgi:acetoin utilization deacetylase AcuC-like enzyme